MFAVQLILFSFCFALLRAETIVKDAPANFTATAIDQSGQRVPVSGEMDTIQILDVHRRGDKTYDPGLSIDINVRPLNQNEQWQSTTPAATYVLPGPGGAQPTAAGVAPAAAGQPPSWFNAAQAPPTLSPLPQPPYYAGTNNVQNLTPPRNAGFTDIADIRTTDNPTNFQTSPNYPFTAGSLAPTQNLDTPSAGNFAPANPTQNFNIPSTGGLAPAYTGFNYNPTPAPTNNGWNFFPTITSTTAPTPFNPFGLAATNPFGFNTSANAIPFTTTPFPWLTAAGSNENGFNFGNKFGMASPYKYGYNLFGGRTGRTGGPNPGESYFESGTLNNNTEHKVNSTGNATLTDLLMNWLYKGGDDEDYDSTDYDYEIQPTNETKTPASYESTINPSIYDSYFKPAQWNKFTNITYPQNSNGAKNSFNRPPSNNGANAWSDVNVNNPWFKLNNIKKLPTSDFASISFSRDGQNPAEWSFNASGPDVTEFFKNTTNFNVSTILEDLNMTFKDPMAWTNDVAGVSTVNVEEMPTIFEIDNYGKPINISEIMESVEKALQNLTSATKNSSLNYGVPPDMLNMFSAMDISQIPLPGNNTNPFKPSDLSNGFNKVAESGFNALSNYSASNGNLTKNATELLNGTTSSETNATSSSSNDQSANEQSHTTSMDKMPNMSDMANMNHDDNEDDGKQSPNASGLEAPNAGVGLAPSWLMCVSVFAGLLGRNWSA